ncbi:MAG: protein kinase domain-containing protein [Christensenellales bacterium]|jgi:serine/threonine protein kinase
MIGKLLGRRYEITEMIDTGGMANVYKALCKKTNMAVAVKVLKGKFSNSLEYVNRFKKEAEAAFSLEQENVVRVTDIGYDEGVYYMVMEYIEGPSLKSMIKKNTRIEEKEAIEYAIQICNALGAAHKMGIIHRDIKPQNILIEKGGKAKLTDFGIAKSVSSDEDQEKKVIGSVYYIAPEQAKGDKVDARTDIYSLGIVMYEMLTGELPYTGGETVAVALKHINEQITPPVSKNSSLSKSINDIVLKATCKNKRDRYHSIGDFKSDLIRALADPDGTFVDLPSIYKNIAEKTRSKSNNRIWKSCILFVLLVMVVSIIIIGTEVFSTSASQMVVIPDLIGLPLSSAVDQMDKTLTIETVYESNEEAEQGTIISQYPDAGNRVVNGNVLSLTVSSGPADLMMPNMVGMTLEDAQELIQTMELTLSDINYELCQDVEPDNVISQLPEAGSTVTINDVVSLTVSAENMQESAVMPEMSGMLLDQAIGLLYDNGFKICFVYQEESDLQEGTVVRQSPEQGIQALYTDDIDLWISEYLKNDFYGTISAEVEIPEKESKVRMVLQEMINGNPVNFVKQEILADAGVLPVAINLESTSGGLKTFKIYVNNVETYNAEVFLSKRI